MDPNQVLFFNLLKHINTTVSDNTELFLTYPIRTQAMQACNLLWLMLLISKTKLIITSI